MKRHHLRAAGLALMLAATVPATGCIQSTTNPVTTNTSVSGVKTTRLPVAKPVFSSQQMQFWCWAATISNAFTWFGHPVSQAAIVADAYGGAYDTSASAGTMARELNRSWVDANGVPFTSHITGLFDAFDGVYALNNDDIRDTLESGRPLVVANTHHAMLLIGITYVEDAYGRVANVLRAEVFDPWPGQGFRPLSQAELRPAPLGGELTFVAAVDVY